MSGTEREYVEAAFRTNWLSTVGPHLPGLEREFSALVGMPAVALGSGTAALHSAIKLVGVRPGNEVVLTTDADRNEAVNRFYAKMGFELGTSFLTPYGRRLNRYQKDL